MTVVVSEEHRLAWRAKRERAERKNARAAETARAALPSLVAVLRDKYAATRIILFGSLARGRFTAESDIDLAAEGIQPGRFFFALGELLAISPFWVDLKPLEDLEPHFKQRVLETGEVIL